jgi:hypothetical protein
MMMGMMGLADGSWGATFVRPARSEALSSARWWRASRAEEAIITDRQAAAATGGANAVEKMYGRAVFKR